MSKRWTEAERQFLRDNAESMNAEELVASIPTAGNRKSVQAVRSMCRRMGFKPRSDDKRRIWTDDELAYLRENCHSNIDALCEHLGRTKNAIKSKLYSKSYGFVEMKRVTPWVSTILEPIPDTGKSLYEISEELWLDGKSVSVEKNRSSGKMAVFCRERGFYARQAGA